MARLTPRFGITRFEADEYYQQALEAFRKGKLDLAITSLTDAIAMQPQRSEFYAARGLFYLEDGVNDKAQQDFQQALKIHPREMLAHYGRGMMAYQSGNLDEALAHFTDAYKSDPRRPETLYYLSLTYHRKKDHEVAHRLMETALGLFPEQDKRRSDAQRWLREFDKLIREKAASRVNTPG
jgi:tetratricopeptide (TPR) repeat protein